MSPPAVSSTSKRSNSSQGDDNIIFVRRRTEQRPLTPEEESNVRWKETFYLNMLVQLEYRLTVSVCTKGPDNRIKDTVKEISKRVYAAPNKTRMDKKGVDYSYSFPLIYFNVEDYDSAWSDLATSEGLHYCVRLFVLLPSSDNTRQIPIFAGSVGWSDLSRVFAARASPTSFLTEKTQYIMMSGPGGKGHCQAAVNPPRTTDSSNSNSSDSLPNEGRNTLRGLWRGLSQAAQVLTDKQASVSTLQCSLTFINVTWHSIIANITNSTMQPTRNAKPGLSAPTSPSSSSLSTATTTPSTD